MDKKIRMLFESECGKKIYSLAEAAIKEYKMKEKIFGGVLVGFSGGPDSVMLLCFLYEYLRREKEFQLAAYHINHSIRGEAADADESFSKEFCKSLKIEFFSRKIDVPALAKTEKLSLEECARNIRYREFLDIILSRNDLSAIAVAHNADDNLETVIINIFRGCGTRGACGIPPVRDNIIRPLIFVKKSDIIKALDAAKIPYVIDKTNNENEYKRNRVRHNIIPQLYNICEDPAKMATRLCGNLRLDEDYINIKADEVLNGGFTLPSKNLAEQHRALQARILSKMAKNASADISAKIIDSICELLYQDNFSYSIPGGAKFICEYGICRIERTESDKYEYRFSLTSGRNIFDDYDADFFITEKKIDDFSLNVYKISIQADLSSAIINGSLYLRPRIDGDKIFYGGITRKIKTLFADLKIPASLRSSIPVLCDDSGVLWVPGFGVRDDGVKDKGKLYATLAIGKGASLFEKRFRSASEYR